MLTQVELRAIEPRDLETLLGWRNALRATGTVRQWRHIAYTDHHEWYESVRNDREHIMRAVFSDSALVGVVGLTYVDWVRRRAEASIYIGDADARGHGLGYAALAALLDYGLGEVNLHRVYAEIFAFNAASIKLFESQGFMHDGRWHDSYLYGLLQHEWAARRRREIV